MLLQIQVHCKRVIELKATYCMYQITFLVVIEIYSITETFKIKLKSSIRHIFCYERLHFIRMRRVLEKQYKKEILGFHSDKSMESNVLGIEGKHSCARLPNFRRNVSHESSTQKGTRLCRI